MRHRTIVAFGCGTHRTSCSTPIVRRPHSASWYVKSSLVPSPTIRDGMARFSDVIGRLPAFDDGLRRAVFPADPSDRRDQPQGPQQRLHAAAQRSWQSLCDRRRRRAVTMRFIPSSARWKTSAHWSRRRGEHDLEIALDFAIQCSPDHPVAQGASGLVRLAAGRNDAIRRKSAEEI